MITTDTKRALPETWTDEACRNLFEHARELGQNGNPAGYFLTMELHPYVGFSNEQGHHLKDTSEWDYLNIRAWIEHHAYRVQRVWQYQIVTGWCY